MRFDAVERHFSRVIADPTACQRLLQRCRRERKKTFFYLLASLLIIVGLFLFVHYDFKRAMRHEPTIALRWFIENPGALMIVVVPVAAWIAQIFIIISELNTTTRLVTLVTALHEAGVLPVKPAPDTKTDDRPANSNP